MTALQQRRKQTEKQNARTILFVRQMHMRKCHLFCASMHQNIPYGTKEEILALNLIMSVSARVLAQLSNRYLSEGTVTML